MPTNLAQVFDDFWVILKKTLLCKNVLWDCLGHSWKYVDCFLFQHLVTLDTWTAIYQDTSPKVGTLFTLAREYSLNS